MKAFYRKLLVVVLGTGLLSLAFLTLPANPVVNTGTACAWSQWGPNCPGVDDHHKSCPNGAAYPANYPACIDSVGLTVPIVVTGLTGNNGSIKIKANARGAGAPGWEDACVANEVRCLLREAASLEESVSSNGTYYFYIDPLGCTSGKCNDDFSVTAQFDTNGTLYTCERREDKTVNLNKNGQDFESPPVGVHCDLPIVTPPPITPPTKTCEEWYCDSPKLCDNGNRYQMARKCTEGTVVTYETKCETANNACGLPTPTPTPSPTPRPGTPTPTPFCPVPAKVLNVHIDCPTCSNL